MACMWDKSLPVVSPGTVRVDCCSRRDESSWVLSRRPMQSLMLFELNKARAVSSRNFKS